MTLRDRSKGVLGESVFKFCTSNSVKVSLKQPTRTPAANTQYRTGSTQHHREFCGDYLPKSTFHTGVNISPNNMT